MPAAITLAVAIRRCHAYAARSVFAARQFSFSFFFFPIFFFLFSLSSFCFQPCR